MRIAFSRFWIQKAGNQVSDYEDAYSPRDAKEGEYAEFFCAVADGATEASFSGLWAKILVDAYVEKRLYDIDDGIIKKLSESWQLQIEEHTNQRPLSWYAEEKLRMGAFSSILGLCLKENGLWSAMSIGDSCLFQLRPKSKAKSFPYTNPTQFDNHPLLLSSNIKGNKNIKPEIIKGKWKEGDCFLLMTDAIAHYFMSNIDIRKRLISNLLNQSEFEEIVAHGRKEKSFRNDDVTLLRVYIKPEKATSVMA